MTLLLAGLGLLGLAYGLLLLNQHLDRGRRQRAFRRKMYEHERSQTR